jgi:type III secretion protein Y
MQASITALSNNLDREHCDLLHLLGYHHLEHGHHERAAMIFEIVLSLNPFNTKAAQALACAHLRGEKAENALDVLDQIPVDQKGDALTWLLKAQAFTKMGRMAEAARAMRMFILKRSEEDFKI